MLLHFHRQSNGLFNPVESLMPFWRVSKWHGKGPGHPVQWPRAELLCLHLGCQRLAKMQGIQRLLPHQISLSSRNQKQHCTLTCKKRNFQAVGICWNKPSTCQFQPEKHPFWTRQKPHRVDWGRHTSTEVLQDVAFLCKADRGLPFGYRSKLWYAAVHNKIAGIAIDSCSINIYIHTHIISIHVYIYACMCISLLSRFCATIYR